MGFRNTPWSGRPKEGWFLRSADRTIKVFLKKEDLIEYIHDFGDVTDLHVEDIRGNKFTIEQMLKESENVNSTEER